MKKDKDTDITKLILTDEGLERLSEQMDADAARMGEAEVLQWTDGNIPTERMKRRFLDEIHHQQRAERKWWRVAAVLIPFLLLSSATFFLAERAGVFTPVQYAEVVVPNGERMQVILQDGTVIELNSATTLRYPKQFSLFSRKVELVGEGYFTVAKESDRPFSVLTKGLEVKVTGTQFNVRAYPEDFKTFITLDEGGVLLNDTYLMNPGESAEYDRSTGKCRISSAADIESVGAWRTNSLNFYLTPLGEIVKVLTRQYDTQFIVNDSTLLDSKYTLSTSKVNVNDVLQDLEKVSHIMFVEREDNQFEIRRK